MQLRFAATLGFTRPNIAVSAAFIPVNVSFKYLKSKTAHPLPAPLLPSAIPMPPRYKAAEDVGTSSI